MNWDLASQPWYVFTTPQLLTKFKEVWINGTQVKSNKYTNIYVHTKPFHIIYAYAKIQIPKYLPRFLIEHKKSVFELNCGKKALMEMITTIKLFNTIYHPNNS